MLLQKESVTDERNRRADRKRGLELHGDRVHRDGSDHRPTMSVDEHLRAGEVAAEAIRVADRHDADPRRTVGEVAAAVTGAFSRRQLLDNRELTPPGEDRLEPIVGWIGSER